MHVMADYEFEVNEMTIFPHDVFAVNENADNYATISETNRAGRAEKSEQIL